VSARVWILATAVVGCLVLSAREGDAQTFDQWFDARVQRAIDALAMGENSKGADRQREAPSDARSTALVDQTSATDFVAAAANLATVIDPRLAGLAGASTPNTGGGSQAVTASLYALVAGLNGVKPTNPEFYRNHVNARRISLTIGTAASDKATHNTDDPATVYGVKVLVWNSRELFTADNLRRLNEVQKQLSTATAAGATLKQRVQTMLFFDRFPEAMVNGAPDVMRFTAFLLTLGDTQFAGTITRASPEVLERIDAEIAAAADPFVTLQSKIRSVYDEIKGGGQLALSYTSNMRPGEGFDEHRAQLIFDYGLSSRLLWTANGSFDYLDKKAAGAVREGRVATEFVGDLSYPRDPFGRVPIRLSLSGQFFWSDGKQTQRDLQVKLSVPLTAGVELPLVYRYTNATEQNVSGAEAKLGLTVDLGRLLMAR
jgi:hypothetical protein